MKDQEWPPALAGAGAVMEDGTRQELQRHFTVDEFKVEGDPTVALRYPVCQCGSIPEDHFHIDPFTVIPREQMKKAIDRYNTREGAQ